jgi:hypothetical protein
MTVSAVNSATRANRPGLAALAAFFLFTHDRHVLAAAFRLPAQAVKESTA